MDELEALQSKHRVRVASGDLKLVSKIVISRPGGEYKGSIVSEDNDHIAERLQKWHEAGTVAAGGDTKAEETEIVPHRNAREIPASEFCVFPDLIARVEKLWSESFFPTQVRAEPCKIHVYGPGGPFKPGRGSPEDDFVGRFFVGLGETLRDANSKYYVPPLFKVRKAGGWTYHHATPGSWIAFYPDVAHSVPEIHSGYGAVIEFKIFRQQLYVPEKPADVMLRGKMENVLMKLQVPYGILLDHHYPEGIDELGGLDAVLYAAAGKTGDAKLLPVQLKWSNPRWGNTEADVYPMTDSHLQAILTHLDTRTEDEEDAEGFYSWRPSRGIKPELFVDLKGTDAEWMHHLGSQPIPFYSLNFGRTATEWKSSVMHDGEDTGRRAHRPSKEEYIYLSYAVVVVPKRGVKRAAEEEPQNE